MRVHPGGPGLSECRDWKRTFVDRTNVYELEIDNPAQSLSPVVLFGGKTISIQVIVQPDDDVVIGLLHLLAQAIVCPQCVAIRVDQRFHAALTSGLGKQGVALVEEGFGEEMKCCEPTETQLHRLIEQVDYLVGRHLLKSARAGVIDIYARSIIGPRAEPAGSIAVRLGLNLQPLKQRYLRFRTQRHNRTLDLNRHPPSRMPLIEEVDRLF